MRDCNYYAELISAGIDAELSADEMQLLDAHLAECEDCRRLQKAMLSVSDATFSDETEPPESLISSTMNRVRAESRKNTIRFIFHLSPVTILSAAVILIFLLGSSVFSRYLPFLRSPSPDTATATNTAVSAKSADNAYAAAEKDESGTSSNDTAKNTVESAAGENTDATAKSQTTLSAGVADKQFTAAAMTVMDGLYAQDKTVFSAIWAVEDSSSDLYPANGTAVDADFVPDRYSAYIMSASDWKDYSAELKKAGIAFSSITPDNSTNARKTVSASDNILVMFVNNEADAARSSSEP